MTMATDQWVFDRAEAALRLLAAASMERVAVEAAAVAAGWPEFTDLKGPSVFTRVSLLRPPVETPGRTVVMALGDAAPVARPHTRVLHGSVAVPAALGAELNRLVALSLGHRVPTAGPLRLKLHEGGVRRVDGLYRWASDAELLEVLAPDERLVIATLRTAGALSAVDISLFAADISGAIPAWARYSI